MSLKIKLDDYEKEVFGTPGGIIVSKKELIAMLESLKPQKHWKILDIGTGTGRIAREILLQEVDLTGVDLNLPRIMTSVRNKRLIKTPNPDYKLINADGQFLPFKDSSFDAITCLRTLKYFPNCMLGIREISRVLKSGGKLVLSVSNLYSIDFVLKQMGMLAYDKLFTFNEIKKMLNLNGLKVISAIPMNKVHPKIWSLSNDHFALSFLNALEDSLQKTTPLTFFPRELMLTIQKK